MVLRDDLDGKRVKAPNKPEVFLIDRGKKRLIPNQQVYLNLFKDWEGIIETNIDAIDTGDPIPGTAILFKYTDSPIVFLSDHVGSNPVKRPINERAMDQWQLNRNKIQEKPRPLGEITLPDGPPIKEEGVWASKIFIVHGHDDLSKLQLAQMLTRMGFEPIILHEIPARGRTIIEKLEEESEDVDFVFVILTPDDVGIDKAYYRARQNVIFELGFFYGKLKRKNVCCLYKRGVEIPSDISGVSYIEFKENPQEKYGEIREELKAAGLEPK